MCGIVGYITDRRQSGSLTPKALEHLLDVMVTRGPDGVGQFYDDGIAMGMRRLSVIDLAGGWQPLFARRDRVVAFQNGEIYNYRELRADLVKSGRNFRTASDTEVIAQGYDAWGIDGLLARLDGMFAIAVLDRDRRELHLARDRFGEKPLYYAHAPGCAFAYGSSFLQMAALPWVQDETDARQLERYLTMHFAPGDRTLLAQVRRVLPGERLTVRVDQIDLTRRRYWRPSLGSPRVVEASELGEMMEAAVRSRMVADVPVGVFLSGGLDSSIVAAAATRVNARVDTFSMGFGDSTLDETAHARAVSDAIGSRHHEFNFDLGKFLDLLPKVADALDEPIGDQALLPVYWLSHEARKHVTVVLSGEGADELFGGYEYYKRFLSGTSPTTHTRSSLTLDELGCLQSGFPVLTASRELNELVVAPREVAPDAWEADVLAWLRESSSPLQRAAAVDLTTWLPDDLLVKFDRMAMAHSLEGRAPFLAPELADVALNLPDASRMSRDQSKVRLRKAAASFGIPFELLERKKQGFVLPMRQWLRDWFSAYNGPAAFFESHQHPGLDYQAATRLVLDDMKSGLMRERLLFALVMLCAWRKSFERRRRELRSLLVSA